jgi:hypothetical protein
VRVVERCGRTCISGIDDYDQVETKLEEGGGKEELRDRASFEGDSRTRGRAVESAMIVEKACGICQRTGRRQVRGEE